MTDAVCRYENYRKISFSKTYDLGFMKIKWSSRFFYKTITSVGFWIIRWGKM